MELMAMFPFLGLYMWIMGASLVVLAVVAFVHFKKSADRKRREETSGP